MATARGKLRIYLGGAPGVGKTYSMLDEGHRRRDRGTDVVIGLVETHGRAKTAALIGDLPVVPRRTLMYRGRTLEEMDVDAVLARHPQVALVDELAHTNAPGSRNAKRWQDVDELLDAGIDVISTLNIQHLESLNDVVAKVTGITQRETVPDAVVRAAEQIELVDMTPEALRRRMLHGNVYSPSGIDAALNNYFRIGNLAALRELALLWVADRVEEGLDDYRARHGITAPWETRERVLVALTGEPEDETLVRRGARMATRLRGELLAVHVEVADGTVQSRPPALDALHGLVHDLGGSYTEITAGDVANALLAFATAENATQLIVARSRHGRLRQWLRGSLVSEILRLAGPIDVHVIATPRNQPQPLPRSPHRGQPVHMPPHRRRFAWALGTVGIALLATALSPLRTLIGLSGGLLSLLLAVVIVTVIGGARPGAAATVIAWLCGDFFFAEPIYSLRIAHAADVAALVVFFAVAALVSVLVDRLARRTLQLARARAEIETLARLAGETVDADAQSLPELLAELRRTFGLDNAAVLVREGRGWRPIITDGAAPPARPQDAQFAAEVGDGSMLTLSGPALSEEDAKMLGPFVTQLRLALERVRLQGEASTAAELAEANTLRATLLEAVSHDLRTPLHTIKAAVTSLLSPETDWDRGKTLDFYHIIDTETDRLTDVVANLLDMSRLQAGALPLTIGPTDLEAVLYNAVDSLADAGSAVAIELAEELPAVQADAGLLERAIANVMVNAQTWSPPGRAVRVRGGVVDGRVEVHIIDQGPGIPAERRAHIFQPFQHRDDAHGGRARGLGLGLAIAKGFTQIMGGDLSVDDTPGGGTTFIFSLPRYGAGEQPTTQRETQSTEEAERQEQGALP
ncbi:MAG TPA: ATP-binding protein [Mycobacterium sp.]|nr:ATP-binding protein [Mycobacterium sp.]HUH72397.1 ATP-binding protein [Mycobacterium sp.]